MGKGTSQSIIQQLQKIFSKFHKRQAKYIFVQILALLKSNDKCWG